MQVINDFAIRQNYLGLIKEIISNKAINVEADEEEVLRKMKL